MYTRAALFGVALLLLAACAEGSDGLLGGSGQCQHTATADPLPYVRDAASEVWPVMKYEQAVGDIVLTACAVEHLALTGEARVQGFGPAIRQEVLYHPETGQPIGVDGPRRGFYLLDSAQYEWQ